MNHTPPPFRRQLFAWLTVICPTLLFVAIYAYLSQHREWSLDTPLLWDIHAVSGSLLVMAAVILHWFGKWYVATLLVAYWAIYQYRQGRPFHALFVALAAALPTAIMSGVKAFMARPRPELWPRVVEETSSSFPSGHSSYAAAMACVLIVLAWHSRFRTWAIMFGVLFALGMAFSRMVLGVHFPSDVLAGLLNGMASVCALFLLLHERLLREKHFQTT